MMAVCGCLSKPSPPTESSCPWSTTATAITDPLIQNMSVNGPWLSDDLSLIWFTLYNSASDHNVVWSAGSHGAFGNYSGAAIDDSNLQDDPYVDTENNELWWSSGSGGTTYIWVDTTSDASDGGAMATMHMELGSTTSSSASTLEPALGPGAFDIYYSPDEKTIWHAHREHIADMFSGMEALSCDDDVESPSIASDGVTIYVTDNSDGPGHISQGTITGTTISELVEVGQFQNPAWRYQDPSISVDDQTLVFAAKPEGETNDQLYYVTRDCTQ